MADIFTKKRRSEIMSKIRSYHTKTTEMAVRNLLRKRKIKFKLHAKGVFGKPDISNEKNKVAVFLDGCFWHGCKKCRSIPKQNRIFWKKKIEYNKKRRLIVKRKLRKDGWKVIEFWEHEINKNPRKVSDLIAEALRSG